jgi:FAD/FMN-containing dehydrogenase
MSAEPKTAVGELGVIGARRSDVWQRHARKVERVVAQLRSHPGDRPLSIRKKAVSHFVPKRGDARRTDDKIDMRDLDEIIEIDPDARICIAEPGVTFADLVRATLRHGLVPMTVPELTTITVGGAVSGCSLESMSFMYGGFHDSCIEYEVLTTDGELLRCTPMNEHALVFEMMHGSFGTLGLLTKLVFRLVPAKPYVHVVYHRHRDLEGYREEILQHYRDRDVDFVDGMIHAPDHHVLNLGTFVDEAPYTHRYDWMRIYYRSTATRTEDYLATYDYYFRYDSGVTNVRPRNPIARLLFGKFLRSTQILRLAERLHRLLPADRPPVTVDLFVPFSTMPRFMDWYRRELAFYPLWVVPYRVARPYAWIADELRARMTDELFIDVAIYGMKQPPGRNIYAEIEQELREVDGIKTLISYNYYDEPTFWTIFNRRNYDAVKRITDAAHKLRDVYDHTCRATQGR